MYKTMKKVILTLSILFAVLPYVYGVPVTLRNNSLKSIPLIIPGVMNPNLSPLSNSGADLPEGQKIYALIDGEEVEILTITPELKNQKIIINKLIKKVKKDRKRNTE
jgi:hypothetical protein